jgi:hypothetical protein
MRSYPIEINKWLIKRVMENVLVATRYSSNQENGSVFYQPYKEIK